MNLKLKEYKEQIQAYQHLTSEIEIEIFALIEDPNMSLIELGALYNLLKLSHKNTKQIYASMMKNIKGLRK